MSNMGSSTVYRRGAGETTEWEDILRAKGITGPSEAEIQRLAAEEAERMAEDAIVRIDPLAHKTVDELDELEEEGGEYADSRVLEAYREARIAEMKKLAAANKFGAVFPLSRADFVEEVTEASKEVFVCVLLYQDHLPESKLLQAVWPQVAFTHKATKFMSIRADACIENYPDKNVPTILVYHEGKSQVPIIGLSELGGTRVDAKTVEWVLSRRGAVKTELEDDPRERSGASSSRGYVKRFGAGAGADSDDD